METERAEWIKRVKAMYDKSATSIPTRGVVLEETILIEDVLTNIIAWCFYPAQDKPGGDVTEQLNEDGISLKLLILRKLDFRDKIDVLKEVVRARKPEVWKTDKELINKIVKELKEIKDFRNLLAHSPLDVSKEHLLSDKDDADSKTFQVLQYRTGKITKVRIDEDRIRQEFRKTEYTWYRLLQLFALLRNNKQDVELCKQLVSLLENLSDAGLQKATKKLLGAYGINHS